MDLVMTVAFVALAAAGALADFKAVNAFYDWDDAALVVLCSAVLVSVAIAGNDTTIRYVFGFCCAAGAIAQAQRREAVRIR
jgi:hypothetical protein